MRFYSGLVLFLLLALITGAAAAAGTPVDMAYIPSAYAMMGAENGDLTASSNAKPYHLVYLDAFYMDKYEVTNEDYATCVNAGKCRAPQSESSLTRSEYYKSVTFAKFPVVNITWQDASDYCAFVEKRLPTEAEWERAARGTSDDRRYPWGSSSPKAVNLNISLIPGDTERTGIYAAGVSPYGVADMLGNVSEWVSDWYDPDWYDKSEQENPTGPLSGSEKVVRGSSFQTGLSEIHVAMRSGEFPQTYSPSIGFRCAMDIRKSIGYGPELDETGPDPEFGYIKAGNDNGIFLLDEPGTGYGTNLIAVIPNGAVAEILAGPVSINYSNWYQIQTQEGYKGWTIASAIVPVP